METRSCRVCGRELALGMFRRLMRGSGWRRVCRPCESRRRMRYRCFAKGQDVPTRYRDPELTLGEHLRILEAERCERSTS
jgi:hypothetical protein